VLSRFHVFLLAPGNAGAYLCEDGLLTPKLDKTVQVVALPKWIKTLQLATEVIAGQNAYHL